MDGPKAYRWLTNMGVAGTIGALSLGVLGMTGCEYAGDTYSGVVVQVDCSAASSGGGMQNCGNPGSPHEEDWTDNTVNEG